MDMEQFFLLIGLLFSNPFIPDYGLQFIVALLIGLILPDCVVNPLDRLVKKVPGVERFTNWLGKNKKIRTLIPRILAGYFFTYLIGWLLLLIGGLSLLGT